MVYSFVKIVSFCFLGHLLFLLELLLMHVFKVINFNTKKFCFTFDFDITYPSTNALFHCELRAFEYAKAQSCTFFDFGVQQMLNKLIAK